MDVGVDDHGQMICWSVLFFAFLDGALGYDCVTCGSRCCKGLGFALAASELVPLATRAPGLVPFMQLRDGLVMASTSGEGCWQLADDGRCNLEVTFGHTAKPSTCRLFPTNRLARAGDVTVVDLQLASCPIGDARDVPQRPGATVIRWADVERELAEAGAGAVTMDAKLPPATPEGWIAREAERRDSTRALLDLPSAAAILGQLGADGATLARLQTAWRRFFALDDSEAVRLDSAVARPWALALPSLRWAALTAPGAPPYPRLQAALDADLLAGAFVATLSTRAGQTPSLRRVAELWRGLPLWRWLLAHWDARVTLADGPAPAGAPPELAAAWTTLQSRARDGAIGEALAATELPPPLRPLLLRLASDRLR
jgi:hypothetical protein